MSSSDAENRLAYLAGATDSPLGRVLANPVLASVSADELPHLVMRLQEFEYADGAAVYSQGDAAEFVYFLATGRCELRTAADESVSATPLSSGDCFGAEVLAPDARYAGDAVMLLAGRVFRLNAQYFRSIFQRFVYVECSPDEVSKDQGNGEGWIQLAESDDALAATLQSWRLGAHGFDSVQRYVLAAASVERLFEPLLLLRSRGVNVVACIAAAMPEPVGAAAQPGGQRDKTIGDEVAELRRQLNVSCGQLESVQTQLDGLAGGLPRSAKREESAVPVWLQPELRPVLIFTAVAAGLAGFSLATVLGLLG
ncbi:MAG TPA: cyclic nucleotide-binding domain-containing protein [Chromatiales bacterium]|nr:cyclic nucleotide-binding domain-containing protein [Chromatiales bacterium]